MKREIKWKTGLPLFLLGLCCCIGPTNRDGGGNNHSSVTPLFGWLHGSCLVVEDGELRSGTPITLIELGPPQRIQAAKITGPLLAEDDCFALFEDRRAVNRSASRFFYRVSLSENDSGFLAIGLVGKHPGIRLKGDSVELPAEPGSGRWTVGSCRTGEGIIFFIRSRGKKPKMVWSDYYYLGYDVEPDCPAGLLSDRTRE